MASIKEALLLVRFNGIRHILRILSFTLKRQRLDRIYHQKYPELNRDHQRSPGKLEQVNPIETGCKFHFKDASLEVKFLSSDLARLTWQPGLLPTPYAIAKHAWPEPNVSIKHTTLGWELASEDLTIQIDPQGSIVFRRAQQTLRTEHPPLFTGRAENTGWTARIEPVEGQFVYGLGDQAGPFNLNGCRRKLWNTDPGGSYGPQTDPIYMPLPVMCVQHPGGSYLVFYENSFPGQVDLSSIQPGSEPQTLRFAKGALRYYFIPGEASHLVEKFTELTGRPEMPPLWSLGYHQSRWGYRSEADIRQVVAGFEAHQMPLSAIHLDIDYMQGYRVFSVDQERFPNLGNLAKELNEKNIKLAPIIDPAIKKDPKYPLYRQGLQKDIFCKLPNNKVSLGMVWPGWSAFPDFTKPQTRDWWGENYRTMLDQGMSGIWHDMNEPTSFSAWGGMALPLSTQHDLDGAKGDHLQAHNLYALQMNRSGYEALKRLRPAARPWLVSRSGWVSQQRYAWKWSGDTESSWGGLHMTIANVLGMGLSGQPYTGPDIGGFSGNPGAELFLRWFQMATFLPFFRTHSAVGTARREPWVYGEPYTSILRNFLNLRYRLLPYLYSLAWQTHQTGLPMVRPLFWNYPEKTYLWGVDDAFLLGDHLLVAPVLQEKAVQRKIVLPPGEWQDFWSGKSYPGGGEITLPVNLETIPLFVQGDAILPLANNDRLELKIHLAQTQEEQEQKLFSVYSDQGEGYGDWRLDQFRWQRQNNRLSMHWDQQGAFPYPYKQTELCLRGAKIQRMWLNKSLVDPVEKLILNQPFQTLEIEL